MADQHTYDFSETDRDRLRRRLTAVTAGDLDDREVQRLAEGELDLVSDLPRPAQQGVRSLLRPGSDAAVEIEKIIGASIDFVPVAYLDLARTAANAVARVVDRRREAVGTGTLVAPGLLLTNHHVTEDEAGAAGQVVQFDFELGVDGTPRTPTEFALDPAAFFWTSPVDRLDATLVAVGSRLSGGRELEEFGHCPLSGAGDKHAAGDFVTVVQHPEGQFKQISLRDNRVLGRGKGGTTLHYSADTLHGSSGSPVFNDQFELVALHHAGGPKNDTTLEDGSPVPEESNEGIRISAIVAGLRADLDAMAPARRRRALEALAVVEDGPRPDPGRRQLPVREPEAPALRVPAEAGVWAETRLTLPIRIILRPDGVVADPGLDLGPPSSQPGTGDFERNQPPDPRYHLRRGYDPRFLSRRVPPPGLSAAQLRQAAVPKDCPRSAEGVRLAYRHFSVVVNAERRMPFFTAVNIDGARSRGINRDTGEIEATEVWFVDPRLAEGDQLAQSLFDRQRPRHVFDRGHMVRRLDPAWGSPETARTAADDTFHFTNCCPQVAAFNQQARRWAGIENFVLDNVRAERERITVFTGPVFGDDDPVFRGVAVPRAFWKLLVRVERGQLRCTAFEADQSDVLDKALADGVEGFGDLGRVAEFQVPVARVARDSGLDLGELVGADTLRAEAATGVRLRTLDDVEL